MVGAWTLALSVVAVGTGALSLLTVESTVVIAAAEYLEVELTTASLFSRVWGRQPQQEPPQ